MLTVFQQEHPSSCVPACLRMVLAHFGIVESEETLRECCKMTPDGTYMGDIVPCAARYGLQAEAVDDQSWSDLLRWLAEGLYPVVALNIYPLEARWALHAVVVESATDEQVVYLDPQSGRRTTTRVAFEQAWRMRYHRAVLIRREVTFE